MNQKLLLLRSKSTSDFRILFSTLFLLLFSYSAFTATITWTGTTSTDWNEISNWSPAQLPGINDDVVITDMDVLTSLATTVKSISLNGTAKLTNGLLTSLTTSGGVTGIYIGADATLLNEGFLDVTNSNTGINNLGTFENQALCTFHAITGTAMLNAGSVINIGSMNFNNIATDGISMYGTSTFNNDGNISMGATSPVGRDGIRGEGTFTNNSTITIANAGSAGLAWFGGIFDNFGDLDITNSTREAIYISNCTLSNSGQIIADVTGITSVVINQNSIFSNTGTIDIKGATSGSGMAVESSAGLTNMTSGIINVANTAAHGISSNAPSFDNQGTINIGDNIGQDGIRTTGNITNSGTINIEDTGDAGIRMLAGMLNNQNAINITRAGNEGIIFQNSTLTNSGALTIDDTALSFLLVNQSGTFQNSGMVSLGNSIGGDTFGIFVEPTGTFTNTPTGEITISNTILDGIISSSSAFDNQGTINIGDNIGRNGISITGGVATSSGEIIVDGAVSYAIQNSGSFTNENGGLITIDNSAGILNFNTFLNNGTIDIGNTSFAAQDGIYNAATFTNGATGAITINGPWGNGIWHQGGTFSNAGLLNIGNLRTTGLSGILARSTFTNTGSVYIDNYRRTGIVNQGGSFTNSSLVIIYPEADPSKTALENTTTLTNTACARMYINGKVSNSGLISNSGLMEINSPVPHSNTGSFINNSVVSFVTINDIPNILNSGLIASPMTLLCPFDVLSYSLNNSYFITNGIYSDLGFTNLVGNFNGSNGDFTLLPSAPNGTYDIYFQVNANGCNFIVHTTIEKIKDGTAPVLSMMPTDGTYSCYNVPPSPNITANDACDGDILVDFDEQRIDGLCPTSYTLKRTWRATDRTGNVVQHKQTIIIEDNNAPTLSDITDPIVYVECTPSYPELPDPEELDLNDCDPYAYIYDVEEVWETADPHGVIPNAINYVVRTYKATDLCGNTSQLEQIFHVVDNAAPIVEFCPADQVVRRDGSAPMYADFEEAIFYDDCDYPVVTYGAIKQGSELEDGENIVEIYATDVGGNTAICAFTITVTDGMKLSDNIISLDVSIPSGNVVQTNEVRWNMPWAVGCTYCDDLESDPNFKARFEFLGEARGHKYFYSNDDLDFFDAKSLASTYNGYWVQMDSKLENQMASNELQFRTGWLGLTDQSDEGTFVWESGDPLMYENWAANQPLTGMAGDTSDAVYINMQSEWINASQNEQHRLVLEIPCYSIRTIASNMPNDRIVEVGAYEVAYEYEDLCGSKDTASIEINVREHPTFYCAPNFHVNALDKNENHWISRVQIGNEIYKSDNDEGFHIKGGKPLASLKAGETYVVSLQGENDINKPEHLYMRAWIDFNLDGDFYDAGEMIMDAFSVNGSESGTFTVPAGVETKILNPTRVRFAVSKYVAPEPCGDFSRGEMEDYFIEVEDPAIPKSFFATKFDFAPYPNPTTDLINVRIDQNNIESLRILNEKGEVAVNTYLHKEETEVIEVNTSSLDAGMYQIELKLEGRRKMVRSFVKVRM